MSLITRIWVTLVVGVLTLSVMAIMGLLFYQVGPTIERVEFPVIENFHLIDTATVEGKLRFRFQTTKLRDCKFLDITWFRRDRNVTSPATIVRVDKAPIQSNLTGVNQSAWWQIIDEPQASTYLAVISYDCRLPWTTMTTLGPVEIGASP